MSKRVCGWLVLLALGWTGCAGEADDTATGGAGAGATGLGGSSGGGGHGVGGSGPSGGSAGAGGQEPFHCDQEPTTSPALAALVYLDPAEPHPGDTLTVIVRSTNGTPPASSPELSLRAETAAGSTVEQRTMRAGGGDTLYYFAVPDVPLGDVCLLALVDGTAPEVSAKTTVTLRPPGPPLTHGVYKVVQNHQWACGEQPTFGNEIHVQVLDENGNGVADVPIDVSYADSTDPGSIYNGDQPIPDTVNTDGSGSVVGYDYWPISDSGLLVLRLAVAGEPSDMATELTTGWWETNDDGCNYCSTYGINVWGHWSHTVTFQRDLGSSEICVVPTDHAGQTNCAIPGHVHHHPTYQACWPAGP